jgi:hypothetical protein
MMSSRGRIGQTSWCARYLIVWMISLVVLRSDLAHLNDDIDTAKDKFEYVVNELNKLLKSKGEWPDAPSPKSRAVWD